MTLPSSVPVEDGRWRRTGGGSAKDGVHVSAVLSVTEVDRVAPVEPVTLVRVPTPDVRTADLVRGWDFSDTTDRLRPPSDLSFEEPLSGSGKEDEVGEPSRGSKLGSRRYFSDNRLKIQPRRRKTRFDLGFTLRRNLGYGKVFEMTGGCTWSGTLSTTPVSLLPVRNGSP